MRGSALLVLLALGCGPPPVGTDAGADAGADAGHQAPLALQRCAGSAGPVGSIVGVVQRLNALPPPVNAACLVSSLPRPLEVVASSSVLSAQPAVSVTSPRIFLLTPAVVLSVVPEGDAGHLLELGEWDTPLRTLKGEIELPVTAPLVLDAPFSRVRVSQYASSCAVCHRIEVPSTSVDGGFVSAAFRPAPGDAVKVTVLAAEHDACVDAGTVSDRCEMFHALFDFGPVKQGAFASNVELFIP